MAFCDNDNEAMQRIAAAEAAVAALAVEYVAYARADIDQVNSAIEALAEAVAGDGFVKTPLADIFATAHNIKGQAASFGFDLLTHVAGSVCGHTRTANTASAQTVDVLRQHGAALKTILDQDIRGDGDDAGRALLEKLAPIFNHEE